MQIDYSVMVIINSALAAIIVLLFSVVAWYFKRDLNSNHEIVQTMQETNEIERQKLEVLRTQVRIIARKSDIEIGE